MPTLGEELRRRREERGTSLAEISEATRIGTRFLKAIETDNYTVLPGGIFTRSFIRSYAKQVGMNEEEAVSLYLQQIASAAGEVPAQQPQVEQRARRPDPMIVHQTPTRTSWSTIIIAAGLVLIISVIVLSLVQRLNRSSSEAGQPATTGEPAPATPGPPAAGTAPDNPAQPGGGQPRSEGAPPPAVSTDQPIVVRLEATTADSSIRYWIDDEPKPTTILLKQGEARDLPPAQSQVRLSIGNRPATRLIINNRQAIYPEGIAMWGAKVTVSRDNLQAFFQ